jgi:glycosyltransferase involved in cell wall biosynthesis
MKIGHYLHPSFGEGGIATLAKNLLKYQEKLGHDVLSFSSATDCPTDCDVIFTHGQQGWIYKRPSPQTKIIHMLHGSNLDRIFAMRNWMGIKGWFCFLKEWVSSFIADGIITDSKSPALEKLLFFKKIRAIIPGGFVDLMEVKTPKINFTPNKFLIIFVGRHDDPVKNFKLAEKIAGSSKIKENIEFLVVPRDTGFLSIPELKYLYLKAKLLLITSFTEGGPLVALEALSSGLPVCATAVGYVPLILDDTCGKIFEDPAEAIEFIENLIQNPERQKKLSQGAKNQSEKFNWSKYASDVSDFIEKL